MHPLPAMRRNAALLPLVIAIGAFPTAAICQQQAPSHPHWAYRAITRTEPPQRDSPWVSNGIDHFILDTILARGLHPAPPATPAQWLRRVTLDLTGLPPAQAELDALLADDTPAARQRIVDELLQRPATAERWTQWWLDLARYADSQGYEKDALRPGIWRWRNWVLEAFASDMPFDQFTVEQLAGDLLPGATVSQRLATAFHRHTMTNTEGGTDDEEFRVAAVHDRVDTTMSVWMGTTMACAQCHDHKYDPFSQREYFGLFAFFDQTEDNDQPDDRPALFVPTPEQEAQAAALRAKLEPLRSKIEPNPNAVLAWAAAERRRQQDFEAAGIAAEPWHSLGPLPGSGSLAATHQMTFAPENDAVRLDAEQHGQRWIARSEWNDGTVQTWRGDDTAMYLFRRITAQRDCSATLALGSDDAIKVWWNGELVLEHLVGRGAAADQELLQVNLRPGTNTLLMKISNGGGPAGFFAELRASAVSNSIQTILRNTAQAPEEAQVRALSPHYSKMAPALAAAREALAACEKELATLRGPRVPILRELGPAAARTTRLHLRGSFLDQGEVILPHTPEVWPPFPTKAPRNRLGLAQWLVSPDNPLPARVLANRIWSEFFGRGLVATLEDFGTQGEAPTHPELLDWLAAQWQASGWSMRALLRLIATSATYAQSAARDPQQEAADAENLWLARGPAVRLSAEALRDQALAVSGLLAPRWGGPSVMPPQPDGVWMQIYSGDRWQAATGDDRYRRALYTMWRRTSPHPAMLLFDAMSRETCVLRRQRTNTPLQALVLWNDPQFQEPARALAQRALTLPVTDEQARISWIWRQCLLREPNANEAKALHDLLASEREQFLAEPQRAAELLADGPQPKVPPAEAKEWAAWTVLAAVILSLDEFVTKR